MQDRLRRSPARARWILVLPSAVVAALLTYTLLAVVFALSNPDPPDPTLLSKAVQTGAFSWAFVKTGSSVAPSHPQGTALVLSVPVVLYLLVGTVAFVINSIEGRFASLETPAEVVGGIVGLVVAVLHGRR